MAGASASRRGRASKPAAARKPAAAQMPAPEPASPLRLDWAEVDSPIGALLVVATRQGVAHLAFREGDGRPAGEIVWERFGPAERAQNGMLGRAVFELGAYFGAGTPLTAPIDWRLAREGYRAEVQRALVTIPFGEVRSYGELAEETGRPRAARAVGSACASNPVPLFSPCHRVIRADGTLGPFGMRLGLARGQAVKRMLLRLEGVEL